MCTCKKYLHTLVFLCFHSRASLNVQMQAANAILKHFRKKKVSSDQTFWLNHELEVTLNYLAELRLRRQNSCCVPWRDLHESLERWDKTRDSRPVKSMRQSCSLFL